MRRNRNIQKTSPNAGKPESEQNLTSFRDATVRPTKVKSIKVKKGIWRTYDATDGLPGEPNRLLQDRRGYLWIATSAGLCRYDGTEFFTYTTANGLAGNDVEALCQDHGGRLWISTTQGLSCFDGREFTNYMASDGLPDNITDALCVDNQGKIWIGTQQGLSCFDGKKFTNYTTADGLMDNEVVTLCSRVHGGIWIGAQSGISRFDNEQFVTLTTEISAEPGPTMWEDRHGRLWIGSGIKRKGVYCFDRQQFRNYNYDDGLVDIQNSVLSVCEDHRGSMWFGTWTGISCFDGSRFINYGDDNGMWSSAVFDIIEDWEGQMWFAHGQLCGLSCYDAETVSLLTNQAAGWTCAQDKEGRIWSGGIYVTGIDLNPQASEVEQRRMPFTRGGTYLMVDSRDQLWVAPVRDGLYCYDSDAVWEAAGGDESSRPRHFGVSDNLADREYVIPLLEMEDGTIWFSLLNPTTSAQFSRLCRFDPDQLPNGKPLESIDIKSCITCLIKDKLGRLWMSGQNSVGLYCWDGSKFDFYTQEDGLPNNYIRSLVEDDSGQIWIGTLHGLCRFDGQRFVTYGEEYNLKDLYHWQSAMDASGQLWFAARGGVYRTNGEHFQWLTEDDGLPSNKVVGVFPRPDGSTAIWTGRGLVLYRPTATIPPGVEIREVVADRVYQNPDEIELTTTAANLLTISYQGLSLATKRMRYSYILEGHDERWMETWDQQARYENLPVGEYTFKVIAINRDLVLSEAPATMKLTVIHDPRDIRVNNLRTEVENLRREAGRKYNFHDIVGQSVAIKQVHALMERAIDSGLTVLIIGETGTGKELVAKAIHYNSSRKDGPLRDLNCGAVPNELVSSTLFGYRKGAFTGATEDRIGLFEAASGGTILLDEIGEMSQDAQIHLLRVLEENKIQRVGDNISRDVDVRIIAMTNRELIKEVEDRRFRKDLYYRLSVFPIYVPPLRERPEDIPLLAEHFLQEMDRELADFSPGVLEMLQSYSWPGNVRELLNAIRRADALAEEGKQIQTYHFSSQITQGESLIQDIISERMGLSSSLELLQRRLIENALRECNGNRTQAAQMLNTQRPNLVRIMKRLGIE